MVVGLPLEFVDREGIADFFGKKVLLHCFYTALTLLSHCCYTAFTLLVHFYYTGIRGS
jgi:hypothetical protein